MAEMAGEIRPWAFLTLTLALSGVSSGLYVQDFEERQAIPVRAVKMSSSHTQLPYEYYSLPFCKPPGGEIVYTPLNLGEILRGDRISNTAYEVLMSVDEPCKIVCNSPAEPSIWDKESSMELRTKIHQSYSVHLQVDNLPAATAYTVSNEVRYEPGFRLGYVKDDKVYVNNHLKFVMSYHMDPNAKTRRVVGFKVMAFSVDLKTYQSSSGQNTEKTCKITAEDPPPQEVLPDLENKILFTYEVVWEKSEIKWASRWDLYLTMPNASIHWFSIMNSLFILFFLSSLLTTIIIRTLRKDIAKYNSLDDDSEEGSGGMEESGWKLVHGDVFRPPERSVLFVGLVGSGMQVFFMAFLTIFFAMLGMLSPASRGSVLTVAIFTYEFMGLFAGYYSGRLYRTFRGKRWKRAAAVTATLFPGAVFAMEVFVNFFIWGAHSSGAIPVGTIASMGALWFGISVPLVFLGHYVGSRKPPYEQPVRTNQIPRQVPRRPWYLGLVPCCLVGGLLLFGACFIELFFIYSAIYENQFYYLFGFLFLVFIILTLACSQVSVVLTYILLCCEDYHWWWHSFLASGGSAIYVLLYSIYYYYWRLDVEGFTPTLVYFSYSIIMFMTFFLLMGTIGFYASFIFVRKIYASIKID